MASDFTVYCHPSVSSFRIFAYTYAGLFAPTIPLMCLGAAIGGAVSNIPAWASGNASYSAGGVLEAILHPLDGFGKFISVLLSFSLLGNLAAAIYSISLNFQLLIPSQLAQNILRVLFTIVYIAVAIPVAIFAAKSFFSSLENFLYLIAYWSAAAVGIISVEHFVFRSADWRKYDHVSCGCSSLLPSGIAAIVAMGAAFGLVVPCMSQVWYTGPLAEETGDIGFEVALVLAPLLYLPLRWVELRVRGC
jgi:purine-cytosine permease-like protein